MQFPSSLELKLNIQGGAKRRHVFEMGSSQESEGQRPPQGALFS